MAKEQEYLRAAWFFWRLHFRYGDGTVHDVVLSFGQQATIVNYDGIFLKHYILDSLAGKDAHDDRVTMTLNGRNFNGVLFSVRALP